MTDLCKELYQYFGSERWNEFDLLTLPAKELEFLARMMGIAHSGTKEKKMVRLLSCRIVRNELAKFGDDPAPVVEAFKRARLKWMCVQANLWRSGNKYSLAVVLLRWRNECRAHGQKFYQQCVEVASQRPVQLSLVLK